MRIVLAATVVLLSLGCGSAASPNQVVAAFYPLAFAAQQLGVPDVRNLTPPGAEPHDVELTPREVAEVQQARAVLYLSHGFQPAVEQAVRGAHGKKVDVLAGLPLRPGDPHVWLDPVLYARVVERIGAALGRPSRALVARVLSLDGQYRRGLAHCERREFVTSHAAFGYLAARYRLHQLSITGVDPQAEPNPQDLASLAKLVRRAHVTTVFFERLVSPKLAETVARAAGAKTAVLDPIEGLTPSEASHGETYLTLMRKNLVELRQALGCR